MQIRVEFPVNKDKTDIQPFFEHTKPLTEEEKFQLQQALDTVCKLTNIAKIGYRVLGESPMVSIEKKEGCLYVEIDEKVVGSVEKRA